MAVDLLFGDRLAESPVEPQSRRAWIGTLSHQCEHQVVFSSGDDEDDSVEPQLLFDSAGQNILPLAESLAKIAEEHFGFVSAVSGEPGEESSTAGDLPARLKALEQSVSSISESLKTFAAAQSAAAPRAPALHAQPKVRSVPPAAADVETPPGLCHRRDLRAAAAEWSSPTQLDLWR